MSIVDLSEIPVGGGDPSTASRSPSPASRGGLTEGGQVARAAGDGGGQGVGRPTVVDVPMREQRSLATVTAEILSYQEAARRMVITYSIEIGRRLIEAKEMVNHGEWGNYIREELGFSQTTANNHMAMFRAYAADQMRLDGDNLKNQAFGNLTYTQALELLALPSEEEREAFVREHDMSDMSTRELREELRRRTGDPSSVTAEAVTPSPQGEGFGTGDADDSAPVRADVGILRDSKEFGPYGEQDDKNGDAERIAELTAQLARANSRASDAEAERDRILRETEESRERIIDAMAERDKAKLAAADAEERAKAADRTLARAKADLQAARDAEAEALKKLHNAEKDKTVPKETLDKLRKEAEKAAEKSFKADYEKLDAAQKEAAKAKAEAEKAKREAEEMAHTVRRYTEEKERLEKELRAAAPEVAQFRLLFEQAQEALSRCVNALPGLPPDKVPGCTKAIKRLLDATLEPLEANKWEAAMPE